MMSFSIKKNDVFNYISWLTFFSLLYVKYVFQINIPDYIVFAIISIMVLKGDKEEILAICACCIPLYTTVNYLYIIILALIVYLIKYGKEIKIGFGIFPVILLFVWELLHGFHEGAVIKGIIAFIMPYIVCLFVMYSSVKTVNYCNIMKKFAICTLFMCFVVISKLYINSGFNIELMFINMQRLGSINSKEETGAFFNPNTLGFFCILASTGLLQTIVSKNGKKIDLILLFSLIFMGMLTLSRTYFVCLLVMLLLFLLANKKQVVAKIKLIIILFAVMIGNYVVLKIWFSDVIENLILRFSAGDISSGRVELFSMYNAYILDSFENFFFGSGLTTRNEVIDAYFGRVGMQVPHNGFQEVLVVWGIVGLILFLWFLIALVCRSKKVFPKQKLINYIPLLLVMLKVQAGQMVTSFYTMLMFMIVYLSLCHDFENG